VTGPFLVHYKKGTAAAGESKNRRQLGEGIVIGQAFANNLKGFDLSIPSGGITAITGVSGSGKSTLMFDVIHASWEKGKPSGCQTIGGFERFRQVVTVHRHTGFNSPLATPATYTGIFDRIRDIFASLDDSVECGFGKNNFSFLNREGRCPVCEGTGEIRVSMDFLPDVTAVCETCNGKRYRPEILECRFRGSDISMVLEMTVSEAALFFEEHKALSRQLEILEKAGLGYLELGQRLDTLSGGESQRLALAAGLMKHTQGTVLYLLEEPSAGLHFLDVEHLAGLLESLANQGNTVVIIEHDPLLIARADFVIELGPEGGERGGYLMTPPRHPSP